ncbi:hypothetical protein GGQ92_003213 [Gracilibacillus halotolerans]|uniref:YpjP-like protein n=1 Tax=Gracilibacillus halotolerans TaxID=74386 RepID=A0A841RVA3_9BACI|nr:YpjP family protein [Gracilibacillus halotolerans]MBB6514388.1 hypothetical protein [Gracilibacillus halotolerans]
MKKWLRKTIVLLISILTLGLYVPPIHLDAEIDDVDKGEITPKEADFTERSTAIIEEEAPESTKSTNDLYRESLVEVAKEQVMIKLGDKIASKIEVPLTEEVLPNLESVLDHVFDMVGEEQSQYLVISEEPAAGYGERIFNLYDMSKQENIAKFHVTRVKKPQDGHYFQFHYHLADDQYEEHFPIAEVHWGKNTPPKWMM